MYAFRTEIAYEKEDPKDEVKNKTECKKAKGTNKSVVKHDLQFSSYMEVLNTQKRVSLKQNSIRSYKHQLYSIEQNKVALSAPDTKRHINDDGISSYAYGHYRISQ
jgi:hypothetical protein